MKEKAIAYFIRVLIPSWLGWVLERRRRRLPPLGAVLIPSWLGWVLEQLQEQVGSLMEVLIPSWLGWVLEHVADRKLAQGARS